MSQIYKSLTSGPVPPSVATSYNTNNGNAVPAANILLVYGIDSIASNDNGVSVAGGVVGTGTANEVDVILTNRIVVTTTTSDGAGQSQSVTVMTPTNGTAVEFTASFIGYDSGNNEAAGGSQMGIARKSAGTATVVGLNDSLDESDAGLVTVDWEIAASGGDLVANFTGVAGRTISWKCLFTFIQV